MVPTIVRLAELPADRLAVLLAESEQAGYRFVRRLLDEWASGANRFHRPGEALFAATLRGRVVGICGLNADPYTADVRVGRVRHLYVLAAYRRCGIGRTLVGAVVTAAQGVFDRLRLRTDSATAARVYEAVGFSRCIDEPDCTHGLGL